MGIATRIIPVLLYDDHGCVKGKQFSKDRRIGSLIDRVRVIERRDVDELILLDVAATPNNRGPRFDLPIGAYGQSKALAETLVLNANNQRPADGPTFRVVRYGNVAGSRGSVIPKWKDMKRQGFDSVDITDPNCTRFYMTMDEAVDLVLSAAKPDNDKPILIPTLPAYKVGDLAEVLGLRKRIIGLPPYEKKHEGMDFGNTSDVARRMSQAELSEAVARV